MLNDLNTYKEFIELYSQAVVIIQDDQIILSNKSAERLIPSIHKKSLKSLLKAYQPLALQRMADTKKNKRSQGSMVYPIHINEEQLIWLELTSNYIEVNGKPATLTFAKSVNHDSQVMSDAILLQRHLALNQNWIQDGCYIKPLHYVTANNPKSFYFTYSRGEHQFGWVGEMQSDLILSSVFIIAMEHYFQLKIESYEWDCEVSPMLEMVDKLLMRIKDALELDQLKYHFWHLDTQKKCLNLTHNGGSGVIYTSDNEIVDFQNEKYQKDTLIKLSIKDIKWLSLGNIEYNMDLIQLHKSDLFLLAEELSNQLYVSGYELHRDLCSVFMDFTRQGTFFEEKFYGVMNAQKRIDDLLDKMPKEVDQFAFRLVLMELLTNAYKHGSDYDDSVPIKAIIYFDSDEVFVEVFDLQSRKERIIVKQTLPIENLLDESGRGLFLINNYADNLYLTGNSIIAKIKNEVE